MNLIISLIIGGIVGWLASIVMKTNAQMGWIANVLVGVVGSLLGVMIAVSEPCSYTVRKQRSWCSESIGVS